MDGVDQFVHGLALAHETVGAGAQCLGHPGRIGVSRKHQDPDGGELGPQRLIKDAPANCRGGNT
ncbi:hypothetical protein WJ969_12280 [Achromobacter xylosoxidans]